MDWLLKNGLIARIRIFVMKPRSLGWSTLLCAMLTGTPCYAQVGGEPQQFECNAQVAFGLSLFNSQNLLNYQEPSTSTALLGSSATITIPPNIVNYGSDPKGYFSNAMSECQLFGIQNLSNVTLNYRNADIDELGQHFTLPPYGFMMIRMSGPIADLPGYYFDNASPTVTAFVKCFAIGN